MTIDLEALESLLADSTPGPWHRWGDTPFLAHYDEYGNEFLTVEVTQYAVDPKADAELIVAALNSLPALIAEIRQLREENQRAKELLGEAGEVLGRHQWQPCARITAFLAGLDTEGSG